MSISNAYKRLRGSTAFLVGLCTFIGTWMTIHVLTGFDRDWGLLNLLLSSEASISMAVLMAIQERVDALQVKTDEHQRKQLLYMQHLLEAQYALLEDNIKRGGLGERASPMPLKEEEE